MPPQLEVSHDSKSEPLYPPSNVVQDSHQTLDAVATSIPTDQQKEEEIDYLSLLSEEGKRLLALNRGIGNPDRDISGEPCAIGLGVDKKYFKYDGPAGTVWFKRNLTAPERTKNLITGEPNPDHMAFERLKNEAAALKFIGENTSIPIPVVRAAFEDNGRFYLLTNVYVGELVRLALTLR